MSKTQNGTCKTREEDCGFRGKLIDN